MNPFWRALVAVIVVLAVGGFVLVCIDLMSYLSR